MTEPKHTGGSASIIDKIAAIAALALSADPFGAIEVEAARRYPQIRVPYSLPKKERSNWAKSVGKRERKLAERKRQRQARRRQRRQ